RGVDLLDADRALAQRERHRGTQLVGIELGAPAVLLDDDRHRDLGVLVGRKALVAALAAATTPDDVAFFGIACLDDLGVLVAAERAAHVSGRPESPWSASAPWHALRRCWRRRAGGRGRRR